MKAEDVKTGYRFIWNDKIHTIISIDIHAEDVFFWAKEECSQVQKGFNRNYIENEVTFEACPGKKNFWFLINTPEYEPRWITYNRNRRLDKSRKKLIKNIVISYGE